MSVIYEEVQEYYGKTLKQSEDLKTNACCTLETPAPYIQKALDLIADEVKDKYYGCGLTIPSHIQSLKILDLGSGSGRDCFIAGYLAGQNGRVVGIDMTEEQLDVAQRHIDYHTEAFGYSSSNVQFIKGNIDALEELNLEEGSFDLIISNCVINLVSDKAKLFRNVYRLLKPGGEMFFSDVYSDRRIPKNLQENSLLWNECLSGALYWNDFLNLAKQAGFTDPRGFDSKPITIENQEIEKLVGDILFYSVTYRLMKLNGLESDCEDYGQAVSYKGGIAEEPSGFKLDDHHYFPKDKIMPVCGNTYKMLYDTRFKDHFTFYGSWDTHFGIFEGCGGNMPFGKTSEGQDTPSCC